VQVKPCEGERVRPGQWRLAARAFFMPAGTVSRARTQSNLA
jgi:hypothetical protein